MEVEVGQIYEIIRPETRGQRHLLPGEIVTVVFAGRTPTDSYCIVEAEEVLVSSTEHWYGYERTDILNANLRRTWVFKSSLGFHYNEIDKIKLGEYPKIVRKIHTMERRHKEFLTKKYSTGF